MPHDPPKPVPGTSPPRSTGSACTRSTASTFWCGRITCRPSRGSAPTTPPPRPPRLGAPGATGGCFEYWAHECSLLPLPLTRSCAGAWPADRGEAGYRAMRTFATERRPEAMALLARLRDEGPLSASDIQTGRAGWWAWSEPKRMLEWLFYAGHVTTATRRRSFERVYDLTERVIPPDILSLPDVPEAEAQASWSPSPPGARPRHGVRTPRLFPPRRAGRRRGHRPAGGGGYPAPGRVPGWPPAYLHRDATIPAASRPEPCSPPSTPGLGARPHRAPVRLSAIASRSTPRRRSGSTGITCCRSCSGRSWWGGWI